MLPPWYSAPTVMHGIFWMVIGHSLVYFTAVYSHHGTVMYGIFDVILYNFVCYSRVRVALQCQCVHRTRKSPDLELKYEILRRTQQNKRHVQITGRHSQPTGNDNKKSYPRPPVSTAFHHQTKAVKEPPSPLQTTVLRGIMLLSHGHKSTATFAKRQFNISIQEPCSQSNCTLWYMV